MSQCVIELNDIFVLLSYCSADRPQMAIRRMRVLCITTKAADTHTKYEILIALPLQRWLLKCASVLCFTYIACLVITETESVYCAVRAECLIGVFEKFAKRYH